MSVDHLLLWMNPPINFYFLLKHRVFLLYLASHVVSFSCKCFLVQIDHFLVYDSFDPLNHLRFPHISEECGSQFHYSDILRHSTRTHIMVKLSIRKNNRDEDRQLWKNIFFSKKKKNIKLNNKLNIQWYDHLITRIIKISLFFFFFFWS